MIYSLAIQCHQNFPKWVKIRLIDYWVVNSIWVFRCLVLMPFWCRCLDERFLAVIQGTLRDFSRSFSLNYLRSVFNGCLGLLTHLVHLRKRDCSLRILVGGTLLRTASHFNYCVNLKGPSYYLHYRVEWRVNFICVYDVEPVRCSVFHRYVYMYLITYMRRVCSYSAIRRF